MTRTIEEAYPLAALQAGMLFHAEYLERTATFHDVLTLTLEGAFDPEALRSSLADLVRRHPVLRTSFDLTDFSEPVQLVHATATVPWQLVDWSTIDEQEAADRLRRWRDEEHFRPHDLAVPPLLRATVHLLGRSTFALSLSFHHVILDGWSVASLVTDLLRRYAARLDGTVLPVRPLGDSYRDFVAAERAARADPASAGFWRERVSDAPAGTLPALPGFPTGDDVVSDRYHFPVAADVTRRLTRVAHDLRVPLRTVLLAAHVRVMALLTGEPDVITGVVTHGRPETESGAEVAGLFLNAVPLRLRADRASWSDLIAAVDAAYGRMLPHRRYPLFEIQQLAGRSPLFETVFDFHDFHVYGGLDGTAPVRLVRQEARETTDIPFMAIFSRGPGDGYVLTLSCHRHRFGAGQVGSIGARYLACLARLAAGPAADPRATEALIADDVARIATWNRGHGRGVGVPDGPGTLPGMVAAWAAATPDGAAVVAGDGQLTFRELWHRACHLAGRITARGIGAESVVAIGIPRSAGAVVATIAAMQAGAAVLPLDLDHPAGRLHALMADAGAGLLLTTTGEAGRFAGTGVATLVETDSPAGAPPGTLPAALPRAPGDLAAVLFTSGSTGRPKGVMLTHSSLTHYCRWQSHVLGLTGADRVAQRSPLSVDGAFLELSLAFAAGGAAVIVPTGAVIDPDAFVEAFAGHGVTATFLVPSLIAPLLQAGAFRRVPALRAVLAGGEAVPRPMVEALGEQSGATVFNIYGPTEIGVVATASPVVLGDPGALVPIGSATADITLHVLDDEWRPVPIGTPGELHIGGRQLARGYFGQPGVTADRFIPDAHSGRAGGRLYRTGDRVRWLPHGELEFLGRRDGQLKVRGVRVELGEIEARLAEHPQVLQATVVVVTQREDTVLGAYVVWSGDREGAAARLRQFCSDRLPPAMIPSHFEFLDEIPLLPNGKIDRSALPDLAVARADFLPPRDLVEARLAALWEEVLETPTVGIRDDFFALGGHSMRALRLTMRIRREFELDIPVESIFSHPTVEQLASVLRRPEHMAPGDPVVALRAQGSRIPVVFMHALGGQVFRYRKLAGLLGDDQPVYAIPARGFSDDQEPHTSLEAMAKDYAQRILEVRPEGPVIVGGFCVGGNIAVEVARQLRSQGTDVPLVTIFWSHAHDPVLPEMDDDAILMMHALAGGVVDVDRERLAGLSPDEQLTAIMEGASAAGRLDPAATDRVQARRMLRVYRANARSLIGHRHAPYPGDALLLKPEDDPYDPADDFGWPETITGHLEIAWIPGSMHNTAEEPQVLGTAATLREVLDRVNADRQGS
jgi:amino acid adenylation domain-containing protein